MLYFILFYFGLECTLKVLSVLTRTNSMLYPHPLLWGFQGRTNHPRHEGMRRSEKQPSQAQSFHSLPPHL